jgi:hypothetical protein
MKRIRHLPGKIRAVFQRNTEPALIADIRMKKILSLQQFFGQGLWEGDLAQMREDDLGASSQTGYSE